MPGSLLRGSLYQQEETRELRFHRGALRLQQLIQDLKLKCGFSTF